MLNRIIKYLIVATLFLIFIVLFSYVSKTGKNWEFVGYQYKWSDQYVKHGGFSSEEKCVGYGDNWLKKQISEETLYTCSTDCKPYTGDLEVCKTICEYDRRGLIQCRK